MTQASQNTMENVLDNGLVIGHAYSVTKMMKVLRSITYKIL